MAYLYEDEDNSPMNEDAWQAAIHRDAEGRLHINKDAWDRAVGKKVEEPLPFTDPAEPEPHCCGNCDNFDGDYCTKWWNNMDDSYKDEDRDSRRPGETCDDWSGEYGFSLKDS